jgi:hypothetical protein
MFKLERFLAGAALTLALAPAAQAAKPPPPPPPVPYEAGPEEFQTRLASDLPTNRVLNEMEIGARAFWRGDYAVAKPALDDAIMRIDAVFAGSPNAANARKLWYDEGSKDFKGEPYERAMAFLYRGLIYLHDADYENARAAFRSGLLQDAFAEEGQNRSDFALLLYLDAWASHLNGDKDLRDETLVQLKLLRPEFGGIGEKDDTLILAETGQAPRKLGDGLDHAFFVYRRGKPILENQVQVLNGAAVLQTVPMEDIYYQASTRGGREIDKILAGKAQFKATTGGVGSFLADTSVNLASNNSAFSANGQYGGAVAAVGVMSGVLLMVSSSAKPQADVRTWSSLPDTVHVLTLATRGKPQTLTAHFLKSGVAVEGEDKPITCSLDENHKQLCLVRAH